jgi:hypothetical protein
MTRFATSPIQSKAVVEGIIEVIASVKLLIGKDDTGTEEMSESIIEEPDETTFEDSLLIPVE